MSSGDAEGESPRSLVQLSSSVSRFLHHFAGAEVGDLGDGLAVALAGEEHVGRLQIAEHHATAVRLLHGFAHLQEQVDGLTQIELARPRVLSEAHPVEVLAHEVERAVGKRAHVDDARHVLGLELERMRVSRWKRSTALWSASAGEITRATTR